MRLKTLEPISAAQAATLVRAVQDADAFAQVRIDDGGREARFEGELTLDQAADAIRSAGLAGVLSAPEAGGHVSGGSTCCGGCG